MKTVRSLPARPLVRALCALALAGAVVIPSSAQPGGAPGQPGQPPAGGAGFPGGNAGGFPGGAGGARGGAPGGPGGARGGRGGQIPTGPAAPVPAEVTIPRPTEAELAQLNSAVNQFVASNPLAKKYASLISVTPPRAVNPAATFTQSNVRNAQRHDAFVALAQKGDIDLLFDGDSITDFWQNAGKPVFDKYFGGMKVANFAVSGDTTQGVLWGLKNGEGQGFSPKAIMLMIGTNNATQGSTGPEIAEGVGAIVMEMRKDFPNAKILLLAIFPRGAGPTDANRLKNIEANKIIAKLHDNKNVFYLDIGDKFLQPDGSIAREIMGDALHPTAAGYEIWAAAVKDKLAELMK